MRIFVPSVCVAVASAALFGFSFGCTGTTNEPTVAGAGTPVARHGPAQKYE